jgi:hypothetical protein
MMMMSMMIRMMMSGGLVDLEVGMVRRIGQSEDFLAVRSDEDRGQWGHSSM